MCQGFTHGEDMEIVFGDAGMLQDPAVYCPCVWKEKGPYNQKLVIYVADNLRGAWIADMMLWQEYMISGYDLYSSMPCLQVYLGRPLRKDVVEGIQKTQAKAASELYVPL